LTIQISCDGLDLQLLPLNNIKVRIQTGWTLKVFPVSQIFRFALFTKQDQGGCKILDLGGFKDCAFLEHGKGKL